MTTTISEPSPDYNYFVNGNINRIAANRVVLCIFTEYGLMNNHKPSLSEYRIVVNSIQRTTGNYA